MRDISQQYSVGLAWATMGIIAMVLSSCTVPQAIHMHKIKWVVFDWSFDPKLILGSKFAVAIKDQSKTMHFLEVAGSSHAQWGCVPYLHAAYSCLAAPKNTFPLHTMIVERSEICIFILDRRELWPLLCFSTVPPFKGWPRETIEALHSNRVFQKEEETICCSPEMPITNLEYTFGRILGVSDQVIFGAGHAANHFMIWLAI